MRIDALADKNILILGYGREGAVTFEVLRRKLPGASIDVTDERTYKEIASFVPLEQAIARADANTVVIKSPGVPWHRPFVRELQVKGAIITSATNLFFSERKGRGCLVGITGTKGKSTTSSLLAHVLATAKLPGKLVGNIGTPMLEELDAPDETIFVVELSSYMLQDLMTGPDIAVLLNLSDEHMDYHGSVAAYREAKWRIARAQNAADTFIYNAAIPEIETRLATVPATTKIPFRLSRDPILDALTLKGNHNRENACAVIVVAGRLGVSASDMRDAFASFVPLPHRLEEVATVNGVAYVNDSISTTPESALAAIDVYVDSLGAILVGGMDRGYDFSALANRLAEMPNVEIFVLPGGERLAQALIERARRFHRTSSIPEAVEWCKSHLVPSQTCLLSPASPSYGHFKNFEERGEVFRISVLP